MYSTEAESKPTTVRVTAGGLDVRAYVIVGGAGVGDDIDAGVGDARWRR